MTIPAKRPVILDLETYNGNPALSQLAKRLMQWVNFTHDRDLFCTPTDPLNLDGVSGGFSVPTARTTVSGGSEMRNFGVAWIPYTLGPQTQAKVSLYVTRATNAATAEFKLTSRRTGRVQTIVIVAGPAGSGWEEHIVDAEGGDAWQLTLTSTHADAISVLGASAWWHAASVVGVTVDAFSKVTLGVAAVDSSYSTFLLRWLARRANQFALERPRPIFVKWWETWKGAGGVNLGRYRVLIGPGVSSIAIHLLIRIGVAPSVPPKLNITLDDGASTWTVTTTELGVGPSYYWRTISLSFPASTQARTMELRIDGDGADGEYRVASFCAWENAPADADLLPGVEAVPASFTPMTDEAVSSRHAIVSAGAAGIATLVGNMAWCWKNRGLRSLVSDCRWDEIIAYGTALADDPLLGVDTIGTNQDGKSVAARYHVNVSSGGTTAIWREGVLFGGYDSGTRRSVRITDDVTDPFDAPRPDAEGVRWSENPSPQAYLSGVHEFMARESPSDTIASPWEARAAGFQFEELPLATTGGGTAR